MAKKEERVSIMMEENTQAIHNLLNTPTGKKLMQDGMIALSYLVASAAADVVNTVLNGYEIEVTRKKRRVSNAARRHMQEAAQARWDKRSPEERKRLLNNLKQFKKDGK